MVEISIECIGQLKTKAQHQPSKAVICTVPPVDNMGDGSSFSPTDLLATSLATCVMTTMDIAAKKHGLSLAGTTARVEKHMTSEGPRRVARLPLVVEMPAGIPEELRDRLEAAGNACPVKRSLHPDIEATIEYRWH